MIQYLKRSLTPLSTVTVSAFLRLTRGGRRGAAEKSHIETSAPDVRSSQSRLRYFTIYTAVFMTALFLCFAQVSVVLRTGFGILLYTRLFL